MSFCGDGKYASLTDTVELTAAKTYYVITANMCCIAHMRKTVITTEIFRQLNECGENE